MPDASDTVKLKINPSPMIMQNLDALVYEYYEAPNDKEKEKIYQRACDYVGSLHENYQVPFALYWIRRIYNG